MEYKYLLRNGEPVPQGWCVNPDNYTTTVTLQIRTMTPLALSALVDLIQTKYEVTHADASECTVVVRNTPPDTK